MNTFALFAEQRKTLLFAMIISASLTLTCSNVRAQKPQPITYSAEGGYIVDLSMIIPTDQDGGFTNDVIRHMAISVGQLSGVNPESGEIISDETHLVSLVSRDFDAVGEAYFYTNVYISGNTYIYGSLIGDGSALTNISTASLIGSLTDRPEIQEALSEKLNADGVWTQLDSNTAEISRLLARMHNAELNDLTLLDAMTDLQANNAGLQTTNAELHTAMADLQRDISLLGTEVSNVVVQVSSNTYLSADEYGNTEITGTLTASNIAAGAFSGDGSALTNLNIGSISGSFAEHPDLEPKFINLETMDSHLLSELSDLQTANFTFQTDVENLHTSNSLHQTAFNNPHLVTAHQVGALPIEGGSMTGAIDMAENKLLNLPEPEEDHEAVTKAYLNKRLSFIIPQGDISMGIYTNLPGY